MLVHTYVDVLLARYAAPCLAGVKPSNLISFPNDAGEWCADYNALLNGCGVYFKSLCVCGKRTMIFVYRKQLLEEYFRQPEVRNTLQSFGYKPENGVPACIQMLWQKMSRLKDAFGSAACKDFFPHEIGLFLGYPVQDVLQYIAAGGIGCLFCGYWKVYGEPEKARLLFSRYQECKEHFALQIKKGMSISEIIHAA